MVAPELPRFAVVGPGRAGSALARAWRLAGAECVGFAGRTIQSAKRAVDFVGQGRVLDPSEVGAAEFVLIAVQDDRLAASVADLAKDSLAPLYAHCSGAHDLEVLAPLAEAGARIGSLHPLVPIPDAETGARNLQGQPAVLEVPEADATSTATLTCLAEAAGLTPIVARGGDRLLYHAACVLAANGATALFGLIESLFARGLVAGGLATDADASRALTGALMQAAVKTATDAGARDALSGPVLRGDAALIERQLQALAALPRESGDPDPAATYRSLMQAAAWLATQRGELRGPARAAMDQVLHG